MANERGRLYDPDADTDYLLNDNTGQVRITSEENFLQNPISRGSIPLTKSENAIFEIIGGTIRTITVQGIKWGTQTQIETFLSNIEAWANDTGFKDDWNYYPLFHPDNSLGNGSQNGSYTVLPESFDWRAELSDAGYIIQWTLVLFQGQKVREFLGF